MFRIDGDHLAGNGKTRQELPADDKRLLIRKGNRPASLHRGDCRPKAHGTGNRVQNNVTRSLRCEPCRLLSSESQVRDSELAPLRLEKVAIASRAEPHDLELLRVLADDRKCLTTN